MPLSYYVWFTLGQSKEKSSSVHTIGCVNPESVCPVSRQPKEGRGRKSWSCILALTLGRKEQRSCSVKKVTELLKESLNSMKIIPTLPDALQCSHVTGMAFALVWQIGPPVLPPWSIGTYFAADYVEVWYVIQPSLQFLVHIDWDLGPESHFRAIHCGLYDFSWGLFDFCHMGIWFLCHFRFVLDLKWQVSVIMLAEPFFFIGLLLESRNVSADF